MGNCDPLLSCHFSLFRFLYFMPIVRLVLLYVVGTGDYAPCSHFKSHHSHPSCWRACRLIFTFSLLRIVWILLVTSARTKFCGHRFPFLYFFFLLTRYKFSTTRMTVWLIRNKIMQYNLLAAWALWVTPISVGTCVFMSVNAVHFFRVRTIA